MDGHELGGWAGVIHRKETFQDGTLQCLGMACNVESNGMSKTGLFGCIAKTITQWKYTSRPLFACCSNNLFLFATTIINFSQLTSCIFDGRHAILKKGKDSIRTLLFYAYPSLS